MAALYVYEAGDSGAPPIVFLHGGGLSGRMWQPQLAALTDFHCLAPDLPEHGRSGSVPFTLPGAAAAVAALIREQKAHIVGLSIGGAVGLEMLRTAPDVVDRAVLSGPTPQLRRTLVTIMDAIIRDKACQCGVRICATPISGVAKEMRTQCQFN